jgi:excisionase family DNA binding protein
LIALFALRDQTRVVWSDAVADNNMRAGSDEDPWLTLPEVSAELRVHPSTVRLWVANGRLAAVRAGGRKWRVRRSEVDRMLSADVSPGYARQAPPPVSTSAIVDPYAPPIKRPGEWVIDTTAHETQDGS